MAPTFDDYDAGILSERQAARLGIKSIQVGDFLSAADGQLARVTHVWPEGVQTTKFSPHGEGGSFCLQPNGKMVYSGGLEPIIPLTHIQETQSRREGNAWFFHHGRAAAHNAVNCRVRVRVWQRLDDSEAINKAIPGRYIVPDGAFRGSVQSTTYTTFDGIERVSYAYNQPLKDYLESRKGLKVIGHAEMELLWNAWQDGMKTAPREITGDQYDEMLNVLPPERFDGNLFHVCERITGNLVDWFFQKNGKFYTFVDTADVSVERLAEIITAA